jgi:hypothetical protein
MAAFAPMVGKHLGVKKVPIKYSINGKTRSVEIPDIMHLAVEPLPSAHPSGETWAAAGHPVAPDKLALGVGGKGNWFADHGMRWDNSGKNGHYAPINWSN